MGPVRLVVCSLPGQTAWLGSSAASKVTRPAAMNSQIAAAVIQVSRDSRTCWSVGGVVSSRRR